MMIFFTENSNQNCNKLTISEELECAFGVVGKNLD
jgi:hypothetical protein